MKQQASMHELDVHDGVLVWLTAPSNQIAEETLYLPSISTISGSAVLGDYKLIQPLGVTNRDACVTRHTSVTDFRPKSGNPVEVTLVTSPKLYIVSHAKGTDFPYP